MLHVITGPPCSGKSTYVREHAQDGDVLVDFDAIAQALGSSVAHGSEGHVREAAFKARNAVVGYLLDNAEDAEGWIIHSSPADWQLEAYEAAGAEFIALDADMETCLERAEQDGRPPDEADKIREWFANNDQAPKGAFFMPSKGGAMNIKTKTVDVKADGDNGSITGYAATFTHDKPDSYGDVIAKGAFAESIERIKAEGKAIPLLWNHDSYDLKSYIGTVTELAEDDHGLLFTATFDGTDTAQRARELASDGRLCKFSFAYQILDQGTVTLEDGTEANELRKLDLYEVSLVMYPANPDTSVVEVKASGVTVVDRRKAEDAIAKSIEDATGFLVQEIGYKLAHDAMPEVTITAVAPNGFKAGKRNSKKDADALKSVLEKLSEIQSIVNGLLEGELADEQEPEPEADGAKANAEEPNGANAEEPQAKSVEVDALLQQAIQLLEKEG